MNVKNLGEYKKIILGIIAILVCVYFGKAIYYDMRFDITRGNYGRLLREVEQNFEPDTVIKNVSVQTDFYDHGSGKYYRKVDYAKIQLTVTDDIETLSGREKCSLLHPYLVKIEEMIRNGKEECGYEKVLSNIAYDRYIKYKGDYVTVEDAVYIEFVSTNYEYSFYPDKFYVIKNNFGGSTEYQYEFEGSELIAFKDMTASNIKQVSQYPYVGMDESDLSYTPLGKPDSIKKCRDYDMLTTRARYKTYEWEQTSPHNWWKVTVRYKEIQSPLGGIKGYVSDIAYTDEKGQLQIDYAGKSD